VREEIIKKSQERLPYMIEMRRNLHKYPETGWLEFRTASIAAKRMRELGYTLTMGEKAVSRKDMMGLPSPEEIRRNEERAVKEGADPELVKIMSGGLTGFWADLECGGGPGPKMGLRFDMDALEIVENRTDKHKPVQEGFASEHHGWMHACGHDSHVAMGLVTAEILASLKDKLKGSLRIIFEPGEEGSRGSRAMVAAGCCKDVDIILGMHIGADATEPGWITCGAQKFLASDKYDVYFKGLAAHSGMRPENGHNAVLAACAATTNMHAISRHSGGATRITVGKIIGGQGRNVIPPEATLIMETRGETTDLNEYMAREARRIIKAAAEMWNCTVDVTVQGSAPSGKSSQEMVDTVMEIARTLPEFKRIDGIINFSGTEDFSRMMTEVQNNGGIGTYIQVGTTLAAGNHNEFFDIDEKDMVAGVRVVCLTAAEYLGG
jgi:aminobenzoyl-glutamate utilization protein A